MENSIEGIEVNFSIYEIFVRDTVGVVNLTNVIEKVIWKAELSRNGVSTTAMGEVILDPPQRVEDFIDISSLTETQVVNWVLIRLGGPVFVEGLKYGHQPHLSKLEYEAQLTRWTTPLIGQTVVPAGVLSQPEIDNLIATINNV